MNYVENILILAKEKGISNKQICDMLGKSTSYINDWKKGKSKPKADEIIILANLFQVTTDFLLTGKNNQSEIKIVKIYNKLNQNNKIKVEGYAEGLLQEQQELADNTKIS